MAQIQSPDETPKRKFEKVKKSANVAVARRKPSFGVLEPTGVLKLGTQASEYYLEVIRNSRQDLTNCISTFGADVPTDMVAAYASPHGTEGGSAFRLNPGKRARIPQVTLYLHGVFDEYPDLRPEGRRRVSCIPDVDAEGKPYLLISLQSELAMKAIPRESNK